MTILRLSFSKHIPTEMTPHIGGLPPLTMGHCRRGFAKKSLKKRQEYIRPNGGEILVIFSNGPAGWKKKMGEKPILRDEKF